MAMKEIKRSKAIFPIGTVIDLTGLTARQIRYYEKYQLITPKRSDTNRRLYSLKDMDRLLEIADLLAEGFTLKGIHHKLMEETVSPPTNTSSQLTDQDVRRILRDELGIENRLV